jgi:hypothetical protein
MLSVVGVRGAGVLVTEMRVARLRVAGPAGALGAVVRTAGASQATAATGRAPRVPRAAGAVLALAGFPHGVYPGTVGTPGSVAGWL